MYKQTYEILLKLGLKQKIGTEEYVIAPKLENRNTVKRNLEDGFRHFWRLKTGKKDNDETYSTLRNTYMTLSQVLAGPLSDMLRRHTRADVTRKHYFNQAFAVSGMFGQNFTDSQRRVMSKSQIFNLYQFQFSLNRSRALIILF